MKNPTPSPCLMIDVAGLTLTDSERETLRHPLVGGVILFTRNYASTEQLTRLCAEIHALRAPPLLIAVDHEGGRVQRFREGFSLIPAMRELGALWDARPQDARNAAKNLGFTLAAELRACGVDLAFAPVLDLDWGKSGVIGNRAFHKNPHAVIDLAGALCEGMDAAGMKHCGKHFPGHGWVEADSHVAVPVDERSLDEMADDLLPYRQMRLTSVMMAHVVYPRINPQPAGFAKVWVSRLRRDLDFKGAIFSDDLSMEGASIAGDIVERARAAWDAGCDMLLICNAPAAVATVLDRWHPVADDARTARIRQLAPARPALTREELAKHPLWQAAQAFIKPPEVKST